MATKEALKYSLLDDLEWAVSEPNRVPLPRLRIAVQHLGPLIQLSRSQHKGAIHNEIDFDWGRFGGAAAFLERLSGSYLSADGTFGMAAIDRTTDAADDLMQRALLALRRTSLPRNAAAQAISALGELDSNIREHSNDEQSGLIGYEVNEQFVGIYASDMGQGVLNSLHRNPKYAQLADDGEALLLAVSEGVSSTGQTGRGMGFRPIFSGLAAHAGVLRFRSGASLLQINGFTLPVPTQEVKERSPTAGFHVNVHCMFNR